MAYLFGIFTVWFVMAGALFVKDSGKHKYLWSYVIWPVEVWRDWQ